MVCDTVLRDRFQTKTQRADEVKRVVSTLDQYIQRRLVQVKVGPQGAIAFNGFPESERNGVSDACAYRKLMASGSALAKTEIMRAEAMAGRSVNKMANVHSHDGGNSWHPNH